MSSKFRRNFVLILPNQTSKQRFAGIYAGRNYTQPREGKIQFGALSRGLGDFLQFLERGVSE